MPPQEPDGLPELIQGLLRAEAYPHPVGAVQLLQTHISWVLLTGSLAYKIKKPVNFGFVDFSTLERRRRCCHEEVRLNRRLNRGLYHGVVAIGGSPDRPRIPAAVLESAAADDTLEYAVRMEQFPQEALLPAALERGSVSPRHIDQLAEQLARFHAEAATAAPDGPYGTPEAVLEPVLANITSLRRHADARLVPRLEQLHAWIEQANRQLQNRFAARLAAGRIRECHGDLHLGNLLLGHGRIEVFDCLEFNPALSWIDPISDIAFLVMDLEERGQRGLGARLLNRWLEQSGDYPGLELWAWYMGYRALVRAKVAALAAEQAAVERYLSLAERTVQRRPQGLVLCHGVSGSGKSHHSGRLLEQLGAIRLRSDVERKRLFGLWGVAEGATARESVGPEQLYAASVTEELFGQVLPGLAQTLLQAGFTVIVDATFLLRRHRRSMAAVAAQAGVPLVILACSAPRPVLEQRLHRRHQRGDDPSDADLAVLQHQWHQGDPLTAAERACCIDVPFRVPGSGLAGTGTGTGTGTRAETQPDRDDEQARALAEAVRSRLRPARGAFPA
ncbi:bifunctional aminoglycoside phosphotransferase/ATP-binding protein [Cyanobium sp. NIES-981]|uniref:bifunctional aminoglycoside phosphotransferase/ATP-binding protein n=1 Tax=Cyanobium sp. NIES-981 TaxID=1851505 RepID=UPI0007DCF2AE|nr:bifunctional aminoglycoside phosphotransferase/ATP-binding protein [Cyanobium sp. NIES-981]SBO42757.1 Uma3 [Cyanobium sp. NIES-981]